MTPPGPLAAGELAHAFDAFFPAFGDDLGGAEVAAEAGAVLVAAHEDDLLGAEHPGGDHRGQAHRAVTDHGHGCARPDSGLDRAMVAGAQHIGQGQQARQRRRVLADWQLDQVPCACGSDGFGLAAADAVESVAAAMRARGLQAFGAELACVVLVEE
ncbi:MAG: hypothetical protein ACLPKI_17435 [Streptosporangiaceae bacterium]